MFWQVRGITMDLIKAILGSLNVIIGLYTIYDLYKRRTEKYEVKGVDILIIIYFLAMGIILLFNF
jgi:hypothetical protein